MKIIIPIQSISDIITNSSSELFATITSEDEETLFEIYKLINNLFGYNQESELTPCVDIYHRPTQEMLDSWDFHSWLPYKKAEEFPENWIEIEMPYNHEDFETFYKAGLESILNERFGKDNYEIIYEDNN